MLDTLLKALNIDPMIMLLNGVVFLVLLFILNQIFWKPVMKHLEGRKHEISDAYKAVDDTRHEMERLRTEYQGRLAKIEAEARGRIQETVKDAQTQREAMIAEARAKTEALMQEGAKSIEAEKVETLANMRSTLDTVAVSALSKATGVEADPAQRKLVDEYISQNVLHS
jgi:F-type H+-transporting ATPase subunit b